MDDVEKSLNLYVCQLQGGSMVEHQKLARKFYGFQSRKFYMNIFRLMVVVAVLPGIASAFSWVPKTSAEERAGFVAAARAA